MQFFLVLALELQNSKINIIFSKLNFYGLNFNFFKLICCKPARLLYLLELRQKIKNFKPVILITGKTSSKLLVQITTERALIWYTIQLSLIIIHGSWFCVENQKEKN